MPEAKAWKPKPWWPVVAPQSLRGAVVGETPADTVDATVGRVASLSLALVLGDVKKQNITASLLITHTDGSRALTNITKLELSQSYVRRQVRKGRSRLDDCFVAKLADGLTVKVKPFVMTKSKITKGQQTAMLKLGRTALSELLSKLSWDGAVQGFVTFKLQRSLADVLKKITPIKTAELRALELTKEAVQQLRVRAGRNF